MSTKNLSLVASMALALLAVVATVTLLQAQSSFASPTQGLGMPSVPVITVWVEGGCDHESIQAAVDAAKAGDTIKVAAGTYADVQSRPAPDGYPGGATITQVVYITKSVAIQGGYAVGSWTTPDPEANPTTIDAQGQGRALFIAQPSTAEPITPTIAGLRITGGDATGLRGKEDRPDTDAGGGVYVFGSSATISATQIYSNAANWGAGLYLFQSEAALVGSAVFSHTARPTYGGGGLYLHHSPAVLRANNVSSNAAERGGGMFLLQSPATMIDNAIVDNTAQDYGGGVRLEWSPATLTGNTIRGNTARSGGGLYLFYSHARLTENVLRDNAADLYGGGLYASRSDPLLTNNFVLYNAAGSHGGGCHLFLRSDAVMTNTVVADNQAEGSGSGLYIWRSMPELRHTTVARNSGGDGSGVYVQYDVGGGYSMVLTNTILVSHSVGISVSAGSVITVNGVLWDTGTPITISQSSLTTSVSVRNQVVGDPAFAPDGYHLLPESDAVDNGVPAGVHIDIDGEPRPLGMGYDLGADEMSPPLFAAFTHSGPDWVGQETVFTNTSIVSGPVSYLWDFGDGTTSTAVNPRHAYTSPGRYTVVLTAFGEDKENVATGSVLIYAASFASSSPDWLGQTTFFTNTTGAGPQADYLWDLGDGVTSTREHVAHTYEAPGSYQVVLRAANPEGSGVVTGTVTVYGPPEVDFVASPTFGFRPLTVGFTSVVTTTPPGDPGLTYLWRFGDGTTETVTSPSHQYVTTGVFTVSLLVSNPVTTVAEVKPELIVVREPRFTFLPLVARGQ